MTPSPDFNRIRRAVAHQARTGCLLWKSCWMPDHQPVPGQGSDCGGPGRAGGVLVYRGLRLRTAGGRDDEQPGKVTSDSAISKVIKDRLRQEGKLGDEKSWNLEYNSFIQSREDFDRFPWDVAEQVETAHVENIQNNPAARDESDYPVRQSIALLVHADGVRGVFDVASMRRRPRGGRFADGRRCRPGSGESAGHGPHRRGMGSG